MNERIEKLAKLSRERDMIPVTVAVSYDSADYALPEAIFNAKRIIEYINAQTVFISDTNRFTGMLRYYSEKASSEVPADSFTRINHSNNSIANRFYYNSINNYNKYREKLVAKEWQHSTANYKNLIDNGIDSVLNKIAFYKEKYRFEKQKYEFLEAEEIVCNGIIKWANKCADECEKAAGNCANEQRKTELITLANTMRKVPQKPAESFYEGLCTMLFCYYFLPDSIGTMDRYLYKLYKKDIDSGVLTRDEAKELLQEFFIYLSNYTPPNSFNSDKSAECHFTVGGYLENGEDGFTDLTKLIVEAIMGIDTRRPAVSLRWTKKTDFNNFKFYFDCQRKDKNNRFAIVNDEPRIKSLMNISGFSWSEAITYTMCGCNEPAFPGAMQCGTTTGNIVRSLVNTLYERTDEVIKAQNFDEFFAIYSEELTKDIDRMIYYNDLFDKMCMKDCNVLSAFMMNGTIEEGRSHTQGGGEKRFGQLTALGTTNVIDSLSIIKQFIFDEKRTNMAHLIDVMKNNWETDIDLHTEIMREGKFFGNGYKLSDEMARRFTTELYNITKNKCTIRGTKIVFGNLEGYHPHTAHFGKMMPATPDGRFDGDALTVGSSQTKGKDREGLMALLQSIAQMDPTGVLCGPVVTNVMFDKNIINDDEKFETVCRMVETYFQMGGLHLQLNFTSKEELLAARKTPEDYKHLKVRVSGYSANFVTLQEVIQDDIIKRTTQE